MTNREFCGHIERNGIKYGVYLEKYTDRVWVDKPSDSAFGQENFGNFTAKNSSEALEVAQTMLEKSGK